MPFISPTLLGASGAVGRTAATLTNTNYTPSLVAGRFGNAWQYIGGNPSATFTTLTPNPTFTFNITTPWTVEFFFNQTSSNAEIVPILKIGNIEVRTSSTPQELRLWRSNVLIANLGGFTTDTWHHFGLMCNGTNWGWIFNGGRVITQTGTISNVNQILIGRNDIITNANINSRYRFDDLRISNIQRYPGSYTVPTAPLTSDANTLGLFHFNDVTNADDIV